MGCRSWNRSGKPRTGWLAGEPKKEKLAVRRFIHESSIPDIEHITDALYETGTVSQRGMLFEPKSARLTLLETFELPYGKKHLTPNIVHSIPSCNENLSVRLGGFIISKLGNDKPKLALEVISASAEEELQNLVEAFEEKGLKLRGDILNGSRPPHLSLAVIDREAEDYFDSEVLSDLNVKTGATVSDAGAYFGSVTLRAVTLPSNLSS